MASRFTEGREKKQRIVHYLKNKSYLPGLSPGQKRVVRDQAKCHIWDEAGDELYFLGTTSKVRKKIVTDEDEVRDILRYYHSSDAGAHSGINATLAKVSTSYIWNGMKRDIRDFVQSCDRCKRCNKLRTLAPELKPTKITELKTTGVNTAEPLELVGMDLVGPLHTTQEGYKYIFTFTDYYTKFVEFFPLKSIEATGDVASCIQAFVYRWGPPKRLISDRGEQFVAKVNNDLHKKLGTADFVTSAYHRQTNGLEERTNQTLLVRLSKLVNDNQDDWADYLDGVAFSMRTQKQTTTKYTPFFLMFGRHPRTVLEMKPLDDDMTLALSETGTEDVKDVDKEVTEREQTKATTYSQVMRNVTVSLKKIPFKRLQSKGIKTFRFGTKEFVLPRKSKNAGCKSVKIEPQ